MPDDKNMFESLRLSAGGGLNSAMEKVAQADKAATIAIGIGGTGLSAIRMFKQTVWERVKQDNYDKRDTEKPQYKRIRFLEIDSDSTQISHPLPQADLSEEFFYIGVDDIIAELGDKAALDKKKHLEWLNRDIKMSDASAGAGGIRQVGKYLLSKKANELYNTFKSMITTSVTGLGANFDLNVYIMGGLGGGTGSGCFVDVCYIMQKALADAGYAGSANVLGFFFLPDVNLSNPNFPKGGPNEILLKKNGYAALKELDYLMGIPGNGDSYRQMYSETFGVHLDVAPVKLCHLLSTTAIDGRVIEDGYNYIMNVVSEYALNFVVKAENADKKGNTSGITLKGIIANINALLDSIYKGHGANYVYNILGTSCATVPYKKIGTYLAIKFFDSIKYISKVRPTRANVEQFCQSIGLMFNKLDIEVKKGAPSLNLDASKFDTNALKSAGLGEISKPLGDYCDKWKNAYANQRTANIKTLGRALDSYVATEAPESIIGRIFKELYACANDPDLGPYYAAYMIQDAQNHTLASVLAGIREEVKKKRDQAQQQNSYRWECLNNAQTEFKSKLDLMGKLKKNYVFMVEMLWKNEVEIETYNEFLSLIDKVKKQLDELEVDFFKKYTGIVDKLIATFKDNADYFNTHGMGNEMYTWSIVDIDSIKNQLDEVIAAAVKREDDTVTAPYFVQKFNSMMFDNQSKWIDESETKIAELISSFIRNEFAGAMTKSMKQYLQEKFDRQGQDLIDCIAADVIKEGLVDKGVPVFHSDPAYDINHDKTNHAEYIVLSIPDDEADFEAAAMKCKTTHNLQMAIAKNVLTDRIYMLEFFSGIPMYAYKDLVDYETVYQQNMSPGTHMYETGEKDWRRLPSPMPATYTSSYYDNPDKAGVEAAIAAYNEAVKLGIIAEDTITKTGTVKVTGELDLGSILTEGWNATKASIANTIEALEQAKSNFAASLAPDGNVLRANQDYENTIRDDFARKPIIVEKVKAEIAKYNSIVDAIAQAQKASEEVGAESGVRDNFIRALLHSVIVRSRSKYYYNFEKRGEVEEIIFTEGNETYEQIPLYRSFVTFKSIDAEIAEQINTKAKKAANNITDEMYEAVVAYFDYYKELYKDWKSEAKSGAYVDSNEIVSFLDELYDRLERFIRDNK